MLKFNEEYFKIISESAVTLRTLKPIPPIRINTPIANKRKDNLHHSKSNFFVRI